MLWDPGSTSKDGDGEQGAVPATPILVPVQHKPTTVEKKVPLLVPDVQELKDQFQHQQNMLTQIKETLKQNESQLTSKEKQVEVYANKLSQIRAKSKNLQGKKVGSTLPPPVPGSAQKTLVKRASKENLAKTEGSETDKTSPTKAKIARRGKISELKKCLEENKIKFEQRTGKEQTETKKIESLVEQLKTQLEERDKTIQDLQRNIEQPRVESQSKRNKLKSDSVASKKTQTIQTQPSDDSYEIITLQNRIFELEANVLDLEENLKEKESVIDARTQAVTLLSQDLSLKGKNTLENLEETRQEMRAMQSNFVEIENRLKKDLSDKENRLLTLEDKYKKSQSTNFDLSVKNAELQERLVNLQKKCSDLEAKSKSEGESKGTAMAEGSTYPDGCSDELQKKIAHLTKELDDRNKSMIKMKIEHKNKLKALNKTLETLKETSDDKAEIVRLSKLVEELESVKTGLENRVAELEDEKATEKTLKDQINELEMTVEKQREELRARDLVQVARGDSGDDQNAKMTELTRQLEAEYSKRVEVLKAEHGKEIEMLESYYNSKMESVDRRELEEYRISTEMNNIHVEEQIELLIREKQQLLEKLKSLSGVSSTDSLAFEKMEHSEIREDKESDREGGPDSGRVEHLQRIIGDQQAVIGDLERAIRDEKEKAAAFEVQIRELQATIGQLEEVRGSFQDRVAEEAGTGQKMSADARNKLRKLDMELAEVKRAWEDQRELVNDLNQKLEEKEELIAKYTQRIEMFEQEDWDRQNHWENAGDGIENVQELQMKCLSLENSMLELNEHCERLRKENIEVVHRLSVEKVKRRKLLEELGSRSHEGQSDLRSVLVEDQLNSLIQLITDMERKVEKLEGTLSRQSSGQSDAVDSVTTVAGDDGAELEAKLEWTNVVLTSKETELFRLQNLLEDRGKLVENLEADLKASRDKLTEYERGLSELGETLRVKDQQLAEIAGNFRKLQEFADGANAKLMGHESQVQQLLVTIKEMESNLATKESELQQIKGVLAQKNNDIAGLKNRLEQVNSDLTHSYQEHLDNMGKVLRDKEAEFEALSLEKSALEDSVKRLASEKEDIHREKSEVVTERDGLLVSLADKDKSLTELAEKLAGMERSQAEQEKRPSQEMDELKTKMKKLAANLKKRAQSEAELQTKVKDLEAVLADKDVLNAKLQADVIEVTEKWTRENTEKDQVRGELDLLRGERSALETENAYLKTEFVNLEKELESNRLMHEGQVKQLEDEIQKSYKMCTELQAVEQEYKDKVFELEAKYKELSHVHESAARVTETAADEERKAMLKNLADVTGKYEEMKFKHDQAVLERSNVEAELFELQKRLQASGSDASGYDAKLQENLAVIEALESELVKVQDQVRYAEEKLFVSEERRLSLESKNEEMCRKITEDSQSLMTIDDLANRVDELLKSEKSLMESVRGLETANGELRDSLHVAQNQKSNLENEVKTLAERLAEASEESAKLKDADTEKSNVISSLSKEMDKTKAENNKIAGEFEKLNRDYEQFEVDFKENLENFQNVEKTLRHKIEELTSENQGLSERLGFMIEKAGSQDRSQPEDEAAAAGASVAEGERKPKKKKSVTFRTDEVEYIKDLKKQIHDYDANLKRANEEIETLKAELLRESLKCELTTVVAEAREKAESLKSGSSESGSPVVVVEPMVQRAETKGLSAQKPDTSSGERKFDASVFFGSDSGGSQFETDAVFDSVAKSSEESVGQSSEFESLMWDDSWGTDGHLEEAYYSTKVDGSGATAAPAGTTTMPQVDESVYRDQIKSLEADVESSRAETERLSKELQDQTAKYTKALKKLKEQRVVTEKLQREVQQLKSSSGFGDLDAAIVDELKAQIEAMEKKERELGKVVDGLKQEKEALLKRIDVLNAGNEKFLEMKERQDNDVEIWQRKNNELLREIASLRQELNEPRAGRDESELAKQVKDLENQVEALEWKNNELTQLIEERDEMLEGATSSDRQPSDVQKVMEEKSILQKEVDELNGVRELLQKRLFDEEKKSSTTIGELNEQLNALAAENETLQTVLGEMKKTVDAAKKEKPIQAKIFDYFKSSSPADDLFPVGTAAEPATPPRSAQPEIDGLKERVFQLEEMLRARDAELTEARQRIADLEGFIRQRDEISAADQQQSLMEVEGLRTKLTELETLLKQRDDEFAQLQAFVAQKEAEANALNQTLVQLQSQRDFEMSKAQHDSLEMSKLLQLREDELQELKRQFQGVVTTSLGGGESRQVQGADSFETVDLTQDADAPPSGFQSERLLHRISDLENLLQLKEEELMRMQSDNSVIDELKQRNGQLEDTVRMRDDELTQLRSVAWTQGGATEVSPAEMDLRQKVHDLEEFVRFKENECHQLQSMNATQTESLNMKIFDLENLLKSKDLQEQNLQQRIYELESVAFPADGAQSGAAEVDGLREKVSELEAALSRKHDEVQQLATRLNEVEKNYNDSKVEIERLLNEEKLNTEEKFVEPFQNNIQIPVAYEVEAITRSLDEEKQKAENLQYELSDKDTLIQEKTNEIVGLTEKVANLESQLRSLEEVESRERFMADESYVMRSQLEKTVADLQRDLDAANHHLVETRREVTELQNARDDALARLKGQVAQLETDLIESTERKDLEIMELRGELTEKTTYYESLLEASQANQTSLTERIKELESSRGVIEREVESRETEWRTRETEMMMLGQTLAEERAKLTHVTALLEEKSREVTDLKETLEHLQEEMGHFRNFEKQVKELRVAKIREGGSDMPVTDEGDPDLTDWTEHELAELSTRLQSDLDTALYMLHQRDVRCDELTFELMQLIEERDTLQLRLSTSLRMNEELRSGKAGASSLQTSKDLVDQSNDRQGDRLPAPSEDLRQLANKISELHSVSYLRDKTVKDDSVQRHTEQMNLLSRVSDTDISLSRDVQNSPTALLNWMRGKSTPKVMHI